MFALLGKPGYEEEKKNLKTVSKIMKTILLKYISGGKNFLPDIFYAVQSLIIHYMNCITNNIL